MPNDTIHRLPARDPRTGSFESLLINDEDYPGPWTVCHIGFGNHMFVNARTGDAVPINSVQIATRKS